MSINRNKRTGEQTNRRTDEQSSITSCCSMHKWTKHLDLDLLCSGNTVAPAIPASARRSRCVVLQTWVRVSDLALVQIRVTHA